MLAITTLTNSHNPLKLKGVSEEKHFTLGFL